MLLETPAVELGWKASDFTLPDLNGNSVSLHEKLGSKGAAVIFMCNHCPYVKAIMERLVEDANVMAQEGIAVLAVMSNDYHSVPADSPVAMRAFAEQYGMQFPYLLDENQSVARAFGAVCTPDIYGLNSSGELQYRGRFDSAGMGSAVGRTADLLEAMREIGRTGRGPVEQVASAGCSIKWRANR